MAEPHSTHDFPAQILRAEDGSPAFAVLRWSDFVRLDPDAARATLSDEDLYDEAMAQPDEPVFPAEVVSRLRRGENPLKVFREWRGLSPAQLAARVNIDETHLSQIEAGGRSPGTGLLSDFARALDVDPDLLVSHDMPLPEPLLAPTPLQRMQRISTVGQAEAWLSDRRDDFINDEGEVVDPTRYRRYDQMIGRLRPMLDRLDQDALAEIFPDLKTLVEGGSET